MTELFVNCIFFITCFFSLFRIKNKKDYQFLFLFISFLLLLIITFRSGNSIRDYNEYVKMYYDYDSFSVRSYAEPSFIFISAILNYFALPAIALFAVYGFLGLGPKVSLIKKISPYYYFSLASYISYEFINQELTAMRAGVATGFVLYSIIFIKKENLIKFSFIIIIATLFHYSAIVCFPLYFFRNIKGKARIILLIISLLVSFFDFTIFARFIPISSVKNKVMYYLSRDNTTKIRILFRFVILYRYFILFFFIKFEKIVKKHNEYIALEINILLYGLLLNNVFSFNELLSYRLSMICFSIEYLLIPNLIFVFKEKTISKLMVVVVSLGNFLYTTIVSNIFNH